MEQFDYVNETDKIIPLISINLSLLMFESLQLYNLFLELAYLINTHTKEFQEVTYTFDFVNI